MQVYRWGCSPNGPVFPLRLVQQGLAAAEQRGLIERDHLHLRPTPLGRRFLNDLQALFLPNTDARRAPGNADCHGAARAVTQPLPAPTLDAAIAALRAGTLSSEALTRGMLDRIAATDANVQAWAFLDRDHALAQARAADARRSTGVEAGALAGIGIGVKDIVSTCDQPTQLGSPIFAGARPAFDAECIVRLKRAGGFVLGKTVTTEFAYMQPGKTRNPWHAAHTPGGSSSGSAAAVALGQVPAALGTQTNGSIVRPAAYCGVVGFKPTQGCAAVRRRGAVQLDTGHARCVRAHCRRLRAAGRCAGRRRQFTRQAGTAGTRATPGVARGISLVRHQHGAARRRRGCGRGAASRRRHDHTGRAPATPVRDAHLVHRCIMLREGAHELGALQQRERQRMSSKLNAATRRRARDRRDGIRGGVGTAKRGHRGARHLAGALRRDPHAARARDCAGRAYADGRSRVLHAVVARGISRR